MGHGAIPGSNVNTSLDLQLNIRSCSDMPVFLSVPPSGVNRPSNVTKSSNCFSKEVLTTCSAWRDSFRRAQCLSALAYVHSFRGWYSRPLGQISFQVFLISDLTQRWVLRYDGNRTANIVSHAFHIVVHLERVKTTLSCGFPPPFILSHFSAEVNRCFLGWSLDWMGGWIWKEGKSMGKKKTQQIFALFSFSFVLHQVQPGQWIPIFGSSCFEIYHWFEACFSEGQHLGGRYPPISDQGWFL